MRLKAQFIKMSMWNGEMLCCEGTVDVTEVLVLHSADDAYDGDHGISGNSHQPREFS